MDNAASPILSRRVQVETFTLLPEDHIDASVFEVRVEWRGPSSWAVCRLGSCLHRRTGEWDFESSPSNRSERFLRYYRFDDRDEAVAAAIAVLPTISVNGWTVETVLARDAERAGHVG